MPNVQTQAPPLRYEVYCSCCGKVFTLATFEKLTDDDLEVIVCGPCQRKEGR